MCKEKNMNSIIKASIIGATLGATIVGAHAVTNYWLIVSGLACILAALVTVLAIPKQPNIYSLVSIGVTSPFLIAAFGYESGWVYLIGLAFVYGMIGVQLFQVTGVAIDNVRFISEKYKRQ